MKLVPSLLALALAWAPCACAGPSAAEEEARWDEIHVHSPSDRVLWQLTLLSLQNLGYPLSSGLNPSSGIVTTGWKTELQPFSGDGTRRRAEVRMKPLEPGLWQVRARVELETNKALVDPLDPSRAEWKSAGDDRKTAEILLMHIRARLDPDLELAPEPEDPRAAVLERGAREPR